jgi:hypothetical protein
MSLKMLVLKYITKSGLSWSMGDLPQFDAKDKLVEEANEQIEQDSRAV